MFSPLSRPARQQKGEGTGMPRPSLRGLARRYLAICGIGLTSLSPQFLVANDEPVVDGQVVPAQFQFKKNETSAKVTDDGNDPFVYHGLTIVDPGTSSSAVKKQAVAETKLEMLPAAARQKTQAVLQNTSLFRRLPTISFEVDRNVYAYFLKNPNLAVSSWRALGISKFTLSEVRPQVYTADAGDGSTGTIEVLYSSPEDTLIYCEGAFKSPLLPKPIVAKAVMRLRAKFQKEADGRIIATHAADVFVELPSQTVETVAKVISPISNAIADRNFKQLTFYAHMMTVAMARQPGWVEAMVDRMTDLTPAQREDFLRLAAASYIASRQREAQLHGQHLSLEDVLAPLRMSASQAPLKPAPSVPSPRVTAQPVSSSSPKK